MPRRPLMSRVAAACTGRPQSRLLPWPRISSGSFSARAQATASCSCSGVAGFRVSDIRGGPSSGMRGKCRLEACASRPSCLEQGVRHRGGGSWEPGILACLLLAPLHRSEPRNVREGQLTAVDVHAAQFGTAVKLGKDLSRVQQMLGIEGALYPLLLLQVGLVEHRGHEVTLLHAHPMFAGQDTADLDTELEDFAAELLRPLQLARLVGVIENERVEDAVGGVKDVRHPQAVALGHLAHAAQDFRQAMARDRAVHAVVVRRDAAHGGEGCLAPGPEEGTLFLAL